MFRLYWKPEQPPGTTRTRRPAVSGKPSSPVMNFLISVAAGSVTPNVIVGAVVADISILLKSGQWSVVSRRNQFLTDHRPLTTPIIALSSFAQNDKLRFHRLYRNLPRDLFRHFAEGRGLRRLRLADDDGDATVSTLAHIQSERHRAQERDAVLLGQLLPAALAEDIVAHPRVRRDEITHVLDDAEHGHGHRLEHPESAPHVHHRNLLRRRHEHSALHRH